jgi:peptidoglycan/LPS O-acetylase OafA/YrhL
MLMAASTSPYFKQIESLRFIAVLGVIFSHNMPDFFGKDVFGRWGVDTFFVISGFLITRILLDSKDKIAANSMSLTKAFKTFYARRILRIFPLFYVKIAIIWFFHNHYIHNTVWWHATFLSNFWNIKTGDWGNHTTSLWSVAVEEQFYIFWSMVVLLTTRRFLLGSIVALIFIAPCLRAYFLANNFSYFYSFVFTPSCFDALGMGALLGYLAYFTPFNYQLITQNYVFRCSTLAIALCAGANMYLEWNGFIHIVLMRFSFALMGFWLIDGCTTGFSGIFGWLLNHRIMQFFGKISYGLYLFETFVSGMLLGMKYPENEWLRFPIYLIVCVAIAALMHYLIERPLNNLKRYFSY